MNPAASACIGLAMLVGATAAVAQVAAVVSTRSPVAALSSEQIVDIFLGKTSRFPDGSPAAPIDQLEGSAVRDDFYQRFAGKSPAQIKAHWSKIIFTGRGQPPRQASSGAEVKSLVVANPGSIGYIEQRLVDGSVKVLLAQ
jgi:ABC-type phosphate transport system substrate-binding protein